MIGLFGRLVPAAAGVEEARAVLTRDDRVGEVEVPARELTRIRVVARPTRSEQRRARSRRRIHVQLPTTVGRRVSGVVGVVSDAQVRRGDVPGIGAQAAVVQKREPLARGPQAVAVGHVAPVVLVVVGVVVAVAQPGQIALHTGRVEVRATHELNPDTRTRLLECRAAPGVVASAELSRRERAAWRAGLIGCAGGVPGARAGRHHVKQRQTRGVSVVGVRVDAARGRKAGNDELRRGGVFTARVVVAPEAVPRIDTRLRGRQLDGLTPAPAVADTGLGATAARNAATPAVGRAWGVAAEQVH